MSDEVKLFKFLYLFHKVYFGYLRFPCTVDDIFMEMDDEELQAQGEIYDIQNMQQFLVDNTNKVDDILGFLYKQSIKEAEKETETINGY